VEGLEVGVLPENFNVLQTLRVEISTDAEINDCNREGHSGHNANNCWCSNQLKDVYPVILHVLRKYHDLVGCCEFDERL
jgi:hypothetical protein